MSAPVTGETITDAQIRELIDSGDMGVRHSASCALFAADPRDRSRERQRCAAAWNSRAAAWNSRAERDVCPETACTDECPLRLV